MQVDPLQPNDQNMAALANLLKNTLSGDNHVIKETESQLAQLERRPQYSLCLLQLITHPQLTDSTLKQSAAIAFKNFVMRNWEYEQSERQEKGEPDIIVPSDRAAIKQHIIQLMVQQPKSIQTQLGHALAIISRHDFPNKWETLLPELVAKFTDPSTDSKPEELLGVLEVMNSIFHRYRSELKSQKLWEEIAIVLNKVADPLSTLFLRWVTRVSEPAHANNPATLPIIIGILSLLVEIFYSLNSQDIAAQFQEPQAKQLWFVSMLDLLKYTNPHLEPKMGQRDVDIDDPTKLDQLKATICDIINLFTWKYEDDFNDYVPKYVDTIWNLLTTLSELKRFDHLVNSSVKFLTSVVRKEQFKSLFGNEAALKAICEKVIIPQLKLRESDLETFEFNCQEYIRMDIEGSDVDTRRRTIVDFIHGLTKQYEAAITTILKGYVDALLADYEAKKQTEKGFLAKDAAIYIILALSAKKSTAKSVPIDPSNPHTALLVSFFQAHIIPELMSTDALGHDILKADCLKYVAVVRQQLPKEFYVALMPLLIRYLSSEHVVIHSYASYAIERLLSVKEPNGSLRLDKVALQPFLHQLLEGLFNVLNHEESKENEYVMKAIMRVCSVGQDSMVPFASVIIGRVTAILSYVSKNPKNPKFNHSLFETIAALIKYLCKSNPALVDSFEQSLFGVFQGMLNQEGSSQEFGPYVFQLMAQLLELRPDDKPISQPFVAVFPAILMPAMWLNSGNVPALTRLLQAYIKKPSSWTTFFTGQGNTRFNGVLGIFQELLRLKSTEGYALDLLTSVIVDFDLNQTNSSLLIAFKQFLFPKLQASPTPRLLQKTVILFLAFLARYGFDTVKAMVDQIQPGIFHMLFDKIVLPNTKLLHSAEDRKLGAIMLTNLAGTPSFLSDSSFQPLWSRVVLDACKLVLPKESKEVAQASAASGAPSSGMSVIGGHGGDEDDHDPDDLLSQSDKGFSTAYAKLVFASIPDRDYFPQVTQTPKEYAKAQIGSLLTKNPQLGGLMSALPSADQQLVQGVLQS